MLKIFALTVLAVLCLQSAMAEPRRRRPNAEPKKEVFLEEMQDVASQARQQSSYSLGNVMNSISQLPGVSYVLRRRKSNSANKSTGRQAVTEAPHSQFAIPKPYNGGQSLVDLKTGQVTPLTWIKTEEPPKEEGRVLSFFNNLFGTTEKKPAATITPPQITIYPPDFFQKFEYFPKITIADKPTGGTTGGTTGGITGGTTTVFSKFPFIKTQVTAPIATTTPPPITSPTPPWWWSILENLPVQGLGGNFQLLLHTPQTVLSQGLSASQNGVRLSYINANNAQQQNAQTTNGVQSQTSTTSAAAAAQNNVEANNNQNTISEASVAAQHFITASNLLAGNIQVPDNTVFLANNQQSLPTNVHAIVPIGNSENGQTVAALVPVSGGGLSFPFGGLGSAQTVGQTPRLILGLPLPYGK